MTIAGRGKHSSRTTAPSVAMLVIGLSTVLWPTVAAAQEHQHPGAGHAGAAEVVALGNMQVPDVVLIDQDGNDVRFYSDLIAGKMVAINFVFTTCTTICPPMGANFAALQRQLGELTGTEVHLISVSVDPVVDTPPRLKAWRDRFNPAPGWTMVTGPKPAGARVHLRDTVAKWPRSTNPPDHPRRRLQHSHRVPPRAGRRQSRGCPRRGRGRAGGDRPS